MSAPTAPLLLRMLGAAGGRKFITVFLQAALLPTLAVYLPTAVAETVVVSLAGVAGAYLFGQSAADALSRGATSSTAIAARAAKPPLDVNAFGP